MSEHWFSPYFFYGVYGIHSSDNGYMDMDGMKLYMCVKRAYQGRLLSRSKTSDGYVKQEIGWAEGHIINDLYLM